MDSFLLWPRAASTNAPAVDHLFLALLGTTFVIALLVFGLMLTFAIRYRRGSPADRGDLIVKTWRWEIGWTSVLLLIALGLFFWGAVLYIRLYRPPQDALDIFVVAKQWMWKVEHPSGQREINELHLPVDQAVRLVMASQDVIHSFYVPAFRIKRDVLPGRYETLWFEPTETGEFHLFCAEYCGTDHSAMQGRIVVMTPSAFERWLVEQEPTGSLAAQGEALFRRYGCSGCHGPGGTVRAPPLEGLYGGPVPLASGEVVTADERYIRDSILLPKSQVAAGYKPIMPSFKGEIGEDDLVKLVAYIKSLAAERRSGE